jgi:pimeloyl-ACP methyl ester carboxylesterase
VEIRASRIWANGLEFGLLEAGAGPLALCLHGFPDTARTWRYLLPELAAAGFRAVAPADGCISVDLVRNAGRHLAPDSRMRVIQGAGHFLQVEQPEEVNQHILGWVTG